MRCNTLYFKDALAYCYGAKKPFLFVESYLEWVNTPLDWVKEI